MRKQKEPEIEIEQAVELAAAVVEELRDPGARALRRLGSRDRQSRGPWADGRVG
jgi:hypothetical protein